MALAKFREDIEERFLENVTVSHGEADGSMWQRSVKAPAAGEVIIWRGDRRIEEEEVCPTRKPTAFRIELASPSAALAEVSIERCGCFESITLAEDGMFSIAEKQQTTRRIKVASAGYVRSFTVHFVEALGVKVLPALTKQIRDLADNPPQWDAATFETFRADLESILREADAPDLLIRGVVEYYLSLYHEELGVGEYRDRLESAYGALRWFIGHSDLARLVCAYFLFRSNEFEAALRVGNGRLGRLDAVSAFYAGNGAKGTLLGADQDASSRGVPLLIPEAEVLTLEGTESLLGDRPNETITKVTAARRLFPTKTQPERAARLDFLEAMALQAAGEPKAARRIFETLCHSPWPSFSKTASVELKDQASS